MKNFISMLVVLFSMSFGMSVQAQGVSTQYLYHSGSHIVTQNPQVVPFRYEGSSQVHYYDKINNTIDGVPQSTRYQGVIQQYKNNQQYIPQNNGYVQSYQESQQYYDPNDPRDVRNIQYHEQRNYNGHSMKDRVTRLLIGNGSNQYQQAVNYMAPRTQAPGYGYEWRYSQKYNSWGWQHQNGSWYFN